METVFDHDITDEEWELVRGMKKDLYLKFVDQETAFYDIASLFYLRGNKEMATVYANKLSLLKKHDLWRTLTHP